MYNIVQNITRLVSKSNIPPACKGRYYAYNETVELYVRKNELKCE